MNIINTNIIIYIVSNYIVIKLVIFLLINFQIKETNVNELENIRGKRVK